MGGEPSYWVDNDLRNAYTRRARARYLNKTESESEIPGLLTFTEMIDEVGKDPEVVSIWGREISYKKDIGSNKKRRH